tara:strand:+ start:104 stop:388 length:285 start_codon:yes stop_codon:yes gene_type:complete
MNKNATAAPIPQRMIENLLLANANVPPAPTTAARAGAAQGAQNDSLDFSLKCSTVIFILWLFYFLASSHFNLSTQQISILVTSSSYDNILMRFR